MAITMELEESASDSKLHKESLVKKELRPSSAVSFSKSEHGPGVQLLLSVYGLHFRSFFLFFDDFHIIFLNFLLL